MLVGLNSQSYARAAEAGLTCGQFGSFKTKVIDGKSEQGNHAVIRQPMKQVLILHLPHLCEVQ